GGGIGYLARGLGLSCDNVISADVVTASGQLVTADEEQNADLFWALRGGGGNFGAVTSFEYRLSPVDQIYGGPVFFELEHAERVLRAYREHIADAPEQLGAFPAFQIAPPVPFIPEDRHGDPMVAIIACWAGPLEEGPAALQPLRDIAPVVAEHLGPMPYPALNSAFDALVPPGLQHYWKANFVTELTDEMIDAHLRYGPEVPTVNSTVHIYPINGPCHRAAPAPPGRQHYCKTISVTELTAEMIDAHLRYGPEVPTVNSTVHIYPSNGACHRVAPDETAFAYRDANFATVIAGMWPDPADNE